MNNELENAVIYVDQALHLKPRLSAALFNKGQVLNQLGRYQEAIEPLRTECGLDPTDAEARYELAFAFYMKKKRHEAMSLISQALHISPHYKAALSLKIAILKGADVNLDMTPPM